MKKNRLFMMAGALCAALGLGSCSNEMEEVAVPADGATRTVTLTVSLPDRGAGTRTAYTADGEGLKVTWAEGDKLTAVYDEFANSTTFTLTSGAGETTATFTGELPVGVSEGDAIHFYYPEIEKKVVGGKTHYIHPDYSTQEGTLAGLSKVDAIEINTEYSEEGLIVYSSHSRYPSFLHFAVGTEVASGSGAATFTISGAAAGYDYLIDDWFDGDIVVDNVTVDSDGRLADDVYIAFEEGTGALLTITVGSEKKVYNLDRYFTSGKMYNISDMSVLSEIKVGMVIGSDGKFYATPADVPEKIATVAMVAYLGSEAEGAAHGLAIALEYVGDSEYTWDNSGKDNGGMTAAELVEDWAYFRSIDVVGEWRLPSSSDWQLMFIGCGSESDYVGNITFNKEFSYGDFCSKLADVDIDSMMYAYPWTSTEYDSDYAFFYDFGSTTFWRYNKNLSRKIRAVFAF